MSRKPQSCQFPEKNVPDGTTTHFVAEPKYTTWSPNDVTVLTVRAPQGSNTTRDPSMLTSPSVHWTQLTDPLSS